MVAQVVTPKPATAPKVKKEPVPPAAMISEMLKRAAVAGKIGKVELESVANLAGALKTFIGV